MKGQYNSIEYIFVCNTLAMHKHGHMVVGTWAKSIKSYNFTYDRTLS